MTHGRAPRRAIDGVLLFDKPLGWSSHQAVQAVKRWYNAARAGHAGTLDPLATGLLAVCLGEATKFSAGGIEADKTYLAKIELGTTTTTADAEGTVLERRAVGADVDAVQRALAQFRGAIEQIPPMYSALKRDGRPLYELARRGIEVERAARPVVIHELELEGFELPWVRLRVRCSKGTYVRTLAEDIGRALGCGAHLSGLTRTAIGSLRLDSAVTAARIEGTSLAERDRLLLATETLLGSLPSLILEALDTARFRQGQLVTVAAAAAAEANHGGTRRVYGPDGLFLGIGEVDAGARLQPRRLVVSASTLVAKHAE